MLFSWLVTSVLAQIIDWPDSLRVEMQCGAVMTSVPLICSVYVFIPLNVLPFYKLIMVNIILLF